MTLKSLHTGVTVFVPLKFKLGFSLSTPGPAGQDNCHCLEVTSTCFLSLWTPAVSLQFNSNSIFYKPLSEAQKKKVFRERKNPDKAWISYLFHSPNDGQCGISSRRSFTKHGCVSKLTYFSRQRRRLTEGIHDEALKSLPRLLPLSAFTIRVPTTIQMRRFWVLPVDSTWYSLIKTNLIERKKFVNS